MLMRREFVTPEKAEMWLKLNTINRTLDGNRVSLYAEDMVRGRWNYGNDDAPVGDISFNCDGTLLNGGTRLAAVVQAKKGQWFVIKREVPIENALLEDHGKPKSINDTVRMFCKIKKQNVPPSLPAFTKAMRTIVQHDGYPGRQQGVQLPFSDWLDFFKKNKAELSAFVTKATVMRALMSHGIAAGLWYLFAKKDAALADQFFEKLKTGTGIQKGEPVGVLRQRLIAERAKKPIERVRHYGIFEWTIRAWNATRDGVRWQKLPSNVGGYPRIK
jgi:hypothetical protein